MSRVRNLVDFTTLTHDFDGDGTLDFSVTGTLTGGAVSSPNVPEVDLSIAPEVLEIQVSAPAAGQATTWLWTWEQSTLPYARRTITNSPEVSVPLYRQGQYVVNNFAAYDLFDQMTQTHSLYLKWIDGAGTDNLVSWATSTGPISDTHPDINGGTATDVQRITVNVPATITLPTLTPPNVTYTVTNNAAGAYTFSGAANGDNPNLGPFYRGGTYTFNVSATGHPFYFTTDNGTNFSSGTYFGEYTDGVTGSRSDSGTVTIVVPNDAPDTLYYQCGNHGVMRGAITVKDLAVETNINGNYVIYFQHTQEGHKTPIELRPIPSLVNQMCIVYDASVNKFVPQDLATYVENTPSFENKIREVAGTAELVVEDGSAVVAKVNVYDDSTYLPLTGNNPGDQAFATDTNILYIWDGSAWQQAGTTNSDDLTEGSTNLFYTDSRVGTYLSSNGYDTATNIVASITDSAPATLDTLNELAAALGDDPNFATTVTNSIATKANSADLATVATSGDYTDLTNTPTIPTNTSDLANDSGFITSADGGNSATLDGLDSTQFLRSDVNSDFTSGYIRFYDSNIERGRLYANGNLVLGTTTPTYEIEIRDNAGNPLVNIDRTNGRVGINGPAYFPLNVTNDVDGVISRWRKDGGTNNPLLEIELSEANNAAYIVQSGSNTGDLGFKIGADIKMMLKNNGNFGIGTDNPSYKLQVEGGNVSFNNGSADTILNLETDTGGTYDVRFNMGSGQNDISTEGHQIWYNNSTGDTHFNNTWTGGKIRFHTATATDKVAAGTNERMTIDENGNVGIGTASPVVDLHLSNPTNGATGYSAYGHPNVGGNNGAVFLDKINSRFDWQDGLVFAGEGSSWSMRVTATHDLATNSDTNGEIFGVHPVEGSGTAFSDTAGSNAVTDAYFRVMGNGSVWVGSKKLNGLGISSTSPANSAKEIKDQDSSSMDGLYYIDVPGQGVVQVYCDMTTDGGGWTLVYKTHHINQHDFVWPSSNAYYNAGIDPRSSNNASAECNLPNKYSAYGANSSTNATEFMIEEYDYGSGDADFIYKFPFTASVGATWESGTNGLQTNLIPASLSSTSIVDRCVQNSGVRPTTDSLSGGGSYLTDKASPGSDGNWDIGGPSTGSSGQNLKDANCDRYGGGGPGLFRSSSLLLWVR